MASVNMSDKNRWMTLFGRLCCIFGYISSNSSDNWMELFVMNSSTKSDDQLNKATKKKAVVFQCDKNHCIILFIHSVSSTLFIYFIYV